MTHRRTSPMRMAGATAWEPPPNTEALWYGNQAVAGGGAWVDVLAGKTIAIPADCSVVEGSGVVCPAGHTAAMVSDYTPATAGAGKGYSVGFWVYSGSIAWLLYLVRMGTQLDVIYYLTPHHVFATTAYGTQTTYDPNSVFGYGAWHHVVFTAYWGDDGAQTGKHGELYIDGVLFASLVPGASTSTGALTVLQGPFQGKLDGLVVASRCWTAEEVAYMTINAPGSHA